MRAIAGSARSSLSAALPAVESFTSPRAWAFALLGIHEYLRRFPKDAAGACGLRAVLTAKLVERWEHYASEDWPWFEPIVTYDNAAAVPGADPQRPVDADTEALEIGLKSLRWLALDPEDRAGHFRPIGSNGFYSRGGARGEFDQQPVEAQAMVSACLEAFRATADPFVVERGASAPSNGSSAATTSACRSTIPAPAAAATGCTRPRE